jgi:protoporphyrinogen oxidase
MTSTRVTILGAGPAGLGAGYRAALAGHEVTILERADRVGGLAGSFEVGGMTVDHGSHRLHPATKPALLSELDRLLGGDLQTRRRHGRIYLEGRWIGFPLQAADLVRNLPLSFALAAGRDALLSPVRRPKDDSFAGLLLAGLGPTMCERFYFPYARKLWGLEPEQIDGEQARRRVSGNAAGKLLRKLTGSGKAGGIFYYPRRGFGQLWGALAEAARAEGARIILDSAVKRVERCGDGFCVSTAAGEHHSELVFSTIPIPVLARLHDPAPPGEVLAAASKLHSRAMVLVYLVIPRDRYTEYDAHYVPDPGTPVSRISEPKNYRDGDDPAGRTVLCAEIPCAVDDAVWSMPDLELGRLVEDALALMELPEANSEAVVVKRVPAAYPVYGIGYAESFGRLVDWAGSVPGLLTFGRHGLFAHNNSHHALEMGWAAAEAIGRDGAFDDEAWSESVAGFASHVVED